MKRVYYITDFDSHEFYRLKLAVMYAAHKNDKNGISPNTESKKFNELYDKLNNAAYYLTGE